MKNPERKIRILWNIVRVGLLVLTVFWFVFALLSGAERYGGGVRGVGTAIFFDVHEFIGVFFLLSLPLTLFGVVFILSWNSIRKKEC